ncbi:MAG: ABC transporter ATP-binding protein [Rhodanobacteraceae bacterium]|nr:ABC transporter ATP-binding protein [Rhodanobacteraceae bacterium]
MLEVNAVGKAFPVKPEKKRDGVADPREQGKLFHALRNVQFSLKKGVILGLLGANGAGKTTLMRILATSLKPTSGSVSLLGFDIVKDAEEVRKRIGFLSGSIGLYGRLNAEELLEFYGKLYGLTAPVINARIAALIDELEIGSFAHRRIETLSAGMKQRVSIARSLIHSPEFIIFDEPTTGLDVPTAQVILGYIESCRHSGKSIIFSTHHMHEVEKLCDQVVLIHQGANCFHGSVEEMKRTTNCVHLDDAYLTLTGEAAPHAARQAMRLAKTGTGGRA